MKRSSIAAFALTFLPYLSAHASARSESACELAVAKPSLSVLKRRYREALARRQIVENLSWSLTEAQDTQTVISTSVELESDSPTGPRFHLMRKGASWNSNYATHPGKDIQGDPRGLPIILNSREAARFFGFDELDQANWIVPGAARMQWSLDQINGVLKRRPIRLNFREAPTGYVTDGSLFDGYTDDRTLYIGRRGNAFVHDLAFHAPSIFIPEYSLALAQSRGRHVRRLRDLAKERWLATSDPIEGDVFKVFESWVIAEGKNLDRATGNFCLALQVLHVAWGLGVAPKDADFKELYDMGYGLLGDSGRSAKSLLAEFAKQVRTSKPTFSIGGAHIDLPKDAATRKAVAAFLDEYVGVGERFDDDAVETKRSQEGFLADVLSRRDEIVAAISLLQVQP